MANIPTGYSFIAWTGTTTALSTAPWKGNLKGVFKINVSRNGLIAYKPASGFPAVTQVENGAMYLFDVLTTFSLADAQLTILSAPPANQLPTVALSLSTNTAQPGGQVTLTVAANDPDGSITKVEYFNGTSKVGESFAGPTFPYVYSGLVAGSYALTAKATDNQSGFTTSASVALTVNPAGNTPPVVNAGADRTVQLPTATTTLTGTATDADGTIASYQWVKVSGPSGGAITSPSAASTTVTGLSAGTYVFRLTATDSGGASANDTVTVTVLADVPRAEAPTNLTVDDDLNALGFRPAFDQPELTQYEYFVGDESSPITVTANPIGLGNIAIPAGGAGARRKATGNLAPSLWLYTTVDFRPDYNPPQPASLTGWISSARRVDLRYDTPMNLTTVGVSGQRVLNVDNTLTLEPYSVLRLDSEVVYVESLTETTITLTSPLLSSHASGSTVERAYVEQMRDISHPDGTEIYARHEVGAPATSPKYLRNPSTGQAWLSFNGVDSRLLFGDPLGMSYTQFIVVDFERDTTVSYITAGSAEDSYPALIANNQVPGLLQFYTKANPPVTIRENVNGICVIGLTTQVGGKNRFYYADQVTPPTKVVEVDSTSSTVDVGATQSNLGGLSVPGFSTKMKFKEYASYAETQLSDADMLNWVEELYTRHVLPAGGGDTYATATYNSTYNSTY